MRLKWPLWFMALLCASLVTEARAAEVAIMPVLGVNLAPGDCDAIGVLFANAFAHDAHVTVASPLETKTLRGDGKPSVAVAMQLGAARYVELSALQLGQRVNLGGSLYAQDGVMLYRAEISAPSLDEMAPALSALAHALAWRQPVPTVATPEAALASPQTTYAPPSEPPPDPKAPRGAYGPKVGLAIPRASGKSFSPGILIQFDGRVWMMVRS